MTTIARELDEKLRHWPLRTSRRVKRLVRRIIVLADRDNGRASNVRRRRKDDPLFGDVAVWTGKTPKDLALHHDDYLYGDRK